MNINIPSYKKMFDLSGKVALITGATGFLGKRFCYGLAESGSAIAVVDLVQENCDLLSTELNEKYGIRSVSITCDISDPIEVQKMVKSVVSELGQINILHNNAATKSDDLNAFFAPFEEYSLIEWKKIMSVNLDGMFLVAQAVGGQMVKQGIGGSIIQTSSIYGIMGPDNRIYEGSFYMGREINTPAIYSASKAGVVGLTKYLATYWAKNGIRVNTLTPGGTESGQNDEFLKRYAARIPMNRMANADEMVGALIFLASDASSYITGHNLIIDGGLNCW
jgi:NAD(P)-dependent dehydrogenase (short-subunit alcohol dehydrogenase family)